MRVFSRVAEVAPIDAPACANSSTVAYRKSGAALPLSGGGGRPHVPRTMEQRRAGVPPARLADSVAGSPAYAAERCGRRRRGPAARGIALRMGPPLESQCKLFSSFEG